MADATPSVEVQELVYGSAAKLLEPGAQDLGVIARTRGLSPDLARQLAHHRDYIAHAAAATAVKYVVGLLSGRVEVTRVEMVTDHTGRRIPFARHVIAPLDPQCRCGDLIRRAVAHARDPRQATAGWIEPAPRLGPVPSPAAASPALAKAVAFAAEVVMQYPQTKRPVLLVQAPGGPQGPADPAVAFVAAVADVVPRSSLAALVAMTHVIEPGERDKVPEAALLATYPGTPFHAEMTARTGARRPLMIDVATFAIDGAGGPEGAFVRATIADVTAGRAGRFADLCDRLGAKPEHYQLVGALDAALARVERQPDVAGLDGFVDAVKKAGATMSKNALGAFAFDTVAAAVAAPSLAVIRDAAGVPGGIERLGALLNLDESILERTVRFGVAVLGKGRRSEAETIAAAVRAAGEDAIAFASRVAAGPQGRAFLDLVAPPVAVPPTGAGGAEQTAAQRMRKPERRQVTQGVGVPMGGGYGGGRPGGMPPGGASGLWWAAVLVSLASVAAGVGMPVWRCYEPPVVSEGNAGSLKKEGSGGRQSTDPVTAGPTAESPERAALKKAVAKAWPRLVLPMSLGLAAVVLLLLNGPLSAASANLLRAVMGQRAAGQVPLVAMVAASLATLAFGLTSPAKNGDKGPKSDGAAAAASNHGKNEQ